MDDLMAENFEAAQGASLKKDTVDKFRQEDKAKP